MRIAAIYCRVSTDNQEAEGTSLQTQLEACVKYCHDKGYDVAYRFSEAYSGLTLERPKLNGLRELVRAGDIDVIVVYCLDRLSRDPTHGVILTQELEKHNVTLEAVTETVDSSELGKLISYIRGFASKLEAEKMRERTMRGKRARAKLGQIPGGGFARTYGYDYVKKAGNNGGRRVINETEAKWVRQIYHWLVYDGLSTTAITKKLNALNVPTKQGRFWKKQTVLAILKNRSYKGKTYAFTMTRNKAKYSKPQEEWIEIPNATPAIINQELFDASLKQLEINRARATRNKKRNYLLNGHLYCHKCRRAYYAYFNSTYVKGKRYEKRRYRCSGSLRTVEPVNYCVNKSWAADKLETLVWAQIERVLNNPELIITEIEKQRQDTNQLGVLEAELQQVERRLSALNR
jgi:site-specific DNA recombinase